VELLHFFVAVLLVAPLACRIFMWLALVLVVCMFGGVDGWG
jgi:hypothetical protein